MAGRCMCVDHVPFVLNRWWWICQLANSISCVERNWWFRTYTRQHVPNTTISAIIDQQLKSTNLLFEWVTFSLSVFRSLGSALKSNSNVRRAKSRLSFFFLFLGIQETQAHTYGVVVADYAPNLGLNWVYNHAELQTSLVSINSELDCVINHYYN